MFDFFKKKKKDEAPTGPHYDPTNIKVTDLRKGFLLDYDLRTWQVTDEFEYDWGDNYFSYEYKLTAGDDTCYLLLEEDEKLYCLFTNKIRFIKLGSNVERALQNDGQPPSEISYEGITYYRESEAPGFFRSSEDAPEDSVEMCRWYYYDEDYKRVLLIDQWDENEFEASAGKVETERAITNILPASN